MGEIGQSLNRVWNHDLNKIPIRIHGVDITWLLVTSTANQI